MNASSEREFRLFLGHTHRLVSAFPTVKRRKGELGRRPVAGRDRLMNQIAKHFHTYSGWTTRAAYQDHLYQLLGRVLVTLKLSVPCTRLLRRVDPAFRVPRD